MTPEQIAYLENLLQEAKSAGQPPAQPPSKFKFLNHEWDNQGASEQEIAQMVQKLVAENNDLKTKLTQAPPSTQVQAPPPPTPGQRAKWNKDEWFDQRFLKGDTLTAMDEALGYNIFGENYDPNVRVGPMLREAFSQIVNQRQIIDGLASKLSDWEVRANMPHIPWDRKEAREELEGFLKQNNLPRTTESYEFAAYRLAQQGKLPTREQWAQGMQQQHANVVAMRPSAPPSAGQTGAPMVDANQARIMAEYEAMPTEKLEEIKQKLREQLAAGAR